MANRFKKKTRSQGFESDVMDGSALNYNEEINLVKSVNINKRNFVYPLFQSSLKVFVYEFIKTYLHGLYMGTQKNENLVIENFAALASNANPVMTAPQIATYKENGSAIIENHSIYVHLRYMGAPYQVTVFLISNGNGMFNDLKYFISVLGIENNSYQTHQLADHIISESIKNSIYKNSIINLKFDSEGRIDIEEMNISEFKSEKLEEIFIPASYKTELKKFYKCIKDYKDIGLKLRYLFSGKPGTGKTKSVRTLINMCHKKATILLTEGDVDFKALFDFARLFEPAIICLDDLDLLVGSRSSNYSPKLLSSFLQELDGFDKNNVFLLATTNDKELVDLAASRPLRFDLTLDFGMLDNKNYYDLVMANTKNEKILNIFDDELMDSLKKKKVTGAFIVNLIHQAEIMDKINPATDLKKYLQNFIEMSYNGFYKEHEDEQKDFGFSMSKASNDDFLELEL
ncbi:MAG: ATP-binding protein [Ignavibacteriae bacterium]|nr:ATP-binding protein [Ignavibacteriota bacterium]